MESIATSGDDLRDLYRELILDHARKPRHFGRLENPSHQAEGINPLCGDKLKIYLDIDSKNKITDVLSFPFQTKKDLNKVRKIFK